MRSSSSKVIPQFLALGLTLVCVTPLFFLAPIVETDLWWHLASGREIVSSGAIPLTDPFSFTFAGEQWISHEWMWDVIHWSAYRLHPDAVTWLTVLVLLAIFVVTFFGGRTLGASEFACAVALLIAATGAHWFLSIRPLLFTLLFVGVIMLTRDRPWAPLLWPLLVLIWVNMHGGFVFGIGAIGLLAVVRTAEASLRGRRLVIQRGPWIAVGVCLLVWMINPWGWTILGYPLDYLSDTGYKEIGEWHAPDLGFDPRNYEGQFWLAALLAGGGAALVARRDAYPVALCSVTLLMAVTSRRFIPLFLVTSAPLVAVFVSELFDRAASKRPVLRSRAAAIGAPIVGLALAVTLWSGVKIAPDSLDRWTGIDRFPQAGVEYLRALGSPERVLNAYDWGGYLILHAPEMKVFFDSRANTLYDEEILQHYTSFLEGRGDLTALTQRYAPDVALVQHGPIVAALQELPAPWSVVYDDGTAVILLPPGSPLAVPQPETVLPEGPGREMILARRAKANGDLDSAAEHLETVIEMNPLLVRAYADLARVQLLRAKPLEAARIIDDGVRSYPRQRRRFRFYEAQVYLESGYLPFALTALRGAYPRGPFGPREFVSGLIARTELQLAAAGGG
jgi:hypothetical protein